MRLNRVKADRNVFSEHGRRGAALIAAYLFDRSLSGRRAVALRENDARSAAAAEYGARLAISELTSWMRTGDGAAGDWVGGDDGSTLYVDSRGKAPGDQRRFGGFLGDREFRVLVRSAALARENDTKPGSWLWMPGAGEALYEITSVARHRDEGTLRLGSEFLPRAMVRTVVGFERRSGVGDEGDPPAARLELPGNFQPVMGANIRISGEDHSINKYFIERFVADRIVTPLKLATSSANYFGARGTYWANGYLTLNYRMDPEGQVNPHRPLTYGFGAGDEDRAMVQRLPGQEPDTYLLGGKRGKTVTLDGSGRIRETSDYQAGPGGNFNVVLGAFEDLMNLYINMAHTQPRGSKESWSQVYIGQYSQEPRDSTLTFNSFPVYAGRKVRAQTIHLLKNQHDQILVREYERIVDGVARRYVHRAPGAVWNGKYAWCRIRDMGNSLLSNESGSVGQVVTPRVFMWQELVGYSLEKREGGADRGEPRLRIPGVNSPDKRTYYRLDANGERIPVGFDEEYQKRDGAGTLADRNDVILVRQPDGSYKSCADMNDFLFEKHFGRDDEGNKIRRDALCLFIGYEDQPESNPPDYNYVDMMFNIFVAPAVEREVVPETLFTLLTDQWWEQDADNGLTGRPAHPALVSNRDPSTLGSESPHADNFGLLGHAPRGGFDDQVYTMRTPGVGKDAYFLRARFVDDGAGNLVFSPLADADGLLIKPGPYYYSEDDVNDFIIHEWNSGNVEMANEEGRDEAGRKFLDSVPADYAMLPIPERWRPPEVEKSELSDDPDHSSYRVADSEFSLRQTAADIIGGSFQRVPTVRTSGFAALDDNGQVQKPSWESLGFLAGEHLQDPGADELAGTPGGEVPHRNLEVAQPDGGATQLRIFVAETPDRAVEMCYQDYYEGAPQVRREVESLYGAKDRRYSIGFHRSGSDDKFRSKHSQDHYEVVSLGVSGFNPYRTTGDGRVLARELTSDPGRPDAPPIFNHALKYGNDGLAPDFTFSRPIDGAGVLVVNGNLVVEDVFAHYGLLLVLGDVVIRPTMREDRLVYGTDGNPTDKYGNSLWEETPGRWVYQWKNPDNPADVRITDLALDAGGKPIVEEGKSVRTVPLMAVGRDAYRGRLVTQGSLMVKGRVLTERVRNEFAAPGDADEFVVGELHCLASKDARALAGKLAGVSKNAARVLSWDRGSADGADESSLWEG